MSAEAATHPVPTTVAPSAWRAGGLAALAALAAYSTGIAWQAQFVSYPLYRAMSADDFPAYHMAYNAAIPGTVIGPGFASFLACAAFPFVRPSGVSRPAAVVVAVSGAGSLLTTALWAIPMHNRLDRIGQDAATISSLLRANAVRTAFLTVATAVLSSSLFRLVRRSG